MALHRLVRALSRGAATVLIGSVCAADSAPPLTLPAALARTLERSPTLAGLAAERHAREASAFQAGRLPNPELRAALEDIGGSGDRTGVEQTETTVRIVQLVELGGKRARRRRVAELRHDGAALEYEAQRRIVVGDATKAFVQALAAQARLALAGELEAIGRNAIDAVTAQVNAGAAPAVELSRARVDLGRAEIDTRTAEREVAATRRALAAQWGDDAPTFGALDGDLTRIQPPPALDHVIAALERHPDLARATLDADERRASLALEQAGRVPDLTVGAGARYFGDNDDFAFVFELGAPLPVFDRNQGAIAAAQHRLERAQADQDATRLALRAAVLEAHARLSAAHAHAIGLRDGVLPTASRALEQAQQTYRRGLFRFDEVLDTQRTLFALRGDYLAALETFHLAAADVARLTGEAAQ